MSGPESTVVMRVTDEYPKSAYDNYTHNRLTFSVVQYASRNADFLDPSDLSSTSAPKLAPGNGQEGPNVTNLPKFKFLCCFKLRLPAAAAALFPAGVFQT